MRSPNVFALVQFGSWKKKSRKVTWIGTHVVKQGVQAANGDKSIRTLVFMQTMRRVLHWIAKGHFNWWKTSSMQGGAFKYKEKTLVSAVGFQT